MLVYVVFQFKEITPQGSVIELQGVFDNSLDAVAACIKSTYCYGAIELNKLLPDETDLESVEFIYPHQEL